MTKLNYPNFRDHKGMQSSAWITEETTIVLLREHPFQLTPLGLELIGEFNKAAPEQWDLTALRRGEIKP